MRSHSSRTVRRVLLALVVVVLAAAYARAAVLRPSTDDAQRAIRAALDSTAAGWNRGDLDAYLALYDPSIVSRGADGFVQGREAAATVMRQGFWRDGRPAQMLRYEHVTVRSLSDRHAIVTGEYVLTGGGRADRTGWFTTVWQRTRAGWRMIHDHS